MVLQDVKPLFMWSVGSDRDVASGLSIKLAEIFEKKISKQWFYRM